MIGLMLLANLLTSMPNDSIAYTRGIGLYPGDKSEYYAPTVQWVSEKDKLTNVALHRMAYAS